MRHNMLPQTRSEQIRKIETHGRGCFYWIVAAIVPAKRLGLSGPGNVWTPVLTPKPYVPYIPVTVADPKKEGQLSLLLGLLNLDESRIEYTPYLDDGKLINAIANIKPIYEWPNLPADDMICSECFAVTPHYLGDILPNGCITCGAKFDAIYE